MLWKQNVILILDKIDFKAKKLLIVKMVTHIPKVSVYHNTEQY